jgi:hypothetical protein
MQRGFTVRGGLKNVTRVNGEDVLKILKLINHTFKVCRPYLRLSLFLELKYRVLLSDKTFGSPRRRE